MKDKTLTERVKIIEQIKDAIDGIFIEAIDNGLTIDRQLVCRGKENLWLEVRIDNNKKDFKIQSIKDYSLTLSDYLDSIATLLEINRFKVKFITLDKASSKEEFSKFPIFNFKEIRKFKILIYIREKSN
jgi:hypothetical protein